MDCSSLLVQAAEALSLKLKNRSASCFQEDSSRRKASSSESVRLSAKPKPDSSRRGSILVGADGASLLITD